MDTVPAHAPARVVVDGLGIISCLSLNNKAKWSMCYHVNGKIHSIIAVAQWTLVNGRLANADDPIDPGGASPANMISMGSCQLQFNPRNTGLAVQVL